MLCMNALWTPVWYDDAGHFHVAQEVAETGQYAYKLNSATGEKDPASQYISMGPVLTEPAAVLISFFKADVMSLRWMVVILTLAMLVLWLRLGSQLTSPVKAFWALVLVAGNIQLLTYGAEFLGETPMLLFFFLGCGLQVRAVQKGNKISFLLAAVAWLGAVLVKESILLPLGFGLLLWMIWAAVKGRWSWLLVAAGQGLFLVAGVLVWYMMSAASGMGLMAYLEKRSTYSGEFLSLDWRVSLPYLAMKPLIWLGGIAIAVKVRVKKQPADVLMGCLFLAQLVLFVLGSGYDRHGFQLLFIPAIYLAEFVTLLWTRARKTRRARALWAALLLAGVSLFSLQQTPLILLRKFIKRHEVNAPEKWVAEQLRRQKIKAIFTYDQELLPFLPVGTDYRLEPLVPHAAAGCDQLELQKGEAFVAGMYARDLYPHCVNWDALTLLAESPEKDYAIYIVLPPSRSDHFGLATWASPPWSHRFISE